MVVDIGEVRKYIKPKADSTLRNMRKDDLIEYIRCIENNYNVAVSFNENQAKYIESLDFPPVMHGRWEWLGPNGLVPECMCGTCSACKVRSKYIVNTDICPNCGAHMDLEVNNATVY